MNLMQHNLTPEGSFSIRRSMFDLMVAIVCHVWLSAALEILKKREMV